MATGPRSARAEVPKRPANRYARAIYTDSGNGPPVSLVGRDVSATPAGYGAYRYPFGNSYYYRYHPRYYAFNAYHGRYPFSPYLTRRYPFGMGPYTNGFGGYSGYGYAPYGMLGPTVQNDMYRPFWNLGAGPMSSSAYSFAPYTATWYNGISPYYAHAPYSFSYFGPSYGYANFGYGYNGATNGFGMPGYTYGMGAYNYYANPYGY